MCQHNNYLAAGGHGIGVTSEDARAIIIFDF